MTPILAWLKKWAEPLARTFVLVFLLTFVASLAKIDFTTFHFSDLSILGSLAAGAVGTAVNVLVIGIQQILPGVPNPGHPAVVDPAVSDGAHTPTAMATPPAK